MNHKISGKSLASPFCFTHIFSGPCTEYDKMLFKSLENVSTNYWKGSDTIPGRGKFRL